MNVKEILKLHEMWLNGDPNGVQADFRDQKITGLAFTQGDLSQINFNRADLKRGILRKVKFVGADFSNAMLNGASLAWSDFSHANLAGADLTGTDLSWAKFVGADLTGTLLARADLTCANLSGAKGLIDPIDFLSDNFEASPLGYIVYKTFGYPCTPPATWDIKPNSVITEVVNFNRSDYGGSGVNVATLEWIKEKYPEEKHPNRDIWKCLIEWPWLSGVCVPYNTDGQIRATRVRLLEVVPQSKEC